MRIIRPEAFHTQPWKNGGGITHEIAREDRDGSLLWRLSIAEVAADGPFSAFPGLSRILTVIEGAGLHLHTPEGRLDALLLAPVAFSGDLEVDSRMIDGPIRDFNVIYDGSRLEASVRILRDQVPACPPRPGRTRALLALAALESLGLPAGALALSEHFKACTGAGFAGVLVTFTQRA